MQVYPTLFRYVLAGLLLLRPQVQAQTPPPTVMMDQRLLGLISRPTSQTGAYTTFIAANQPSKAGAGQRTLIIFLKVMDDVEDQAEQLPEMCKIFVAAHPDVVMALPLYRRITVVTPDHVAAIINEAATHYQVSPRHVILMGYVSESLRVADIAGKSPEQFAGLAEMGLNALVYPTFTPQLKAKAPKMAVFCSLNKGGNGSIQPAFEVAAFKYYGFADAQLEQFERPRDGSTGKEGGLIVTDFYQTLERMMHFFKPIIERNDTAEKMTAVLGKPAPVARAEKLPPYVTLTQRTLPAAKATSAQATAGNPPGENYLLLTHNAGKPAPAKGYTLLVALHGPGDTAENFAKNFIPLIQNRADLVIAIPENTSAILLMPTLVADAATAAPVNPAHVLLMGHDVGGREASYALNRYPDLFAAYAGVATDSLTILSHPSANLQKKASQLAIYYAVGKKDAMFREVYDANVRLLKNLHFTTMLTEALDCGHALTQEEVGDMMAFFDHSLAQADKRTAAMPVSATAGL